MKMVTKTFEKPSYAMMHEIEWLVEYALAVGLRFELVGDFVGALHFSHFDAGSGFINAALSIARSFSFSAWCLGR